MKIAVALLLFAVSAGTSACGNRPPYEGGAGEPLFPLAIGNSWSYGVRESDGDIKEKTQTITGTTADGAYIFRTETGDDFTVSIQRHAGTQLVRESEESGENEVVLDRIHFEPPDLRVDLDNTRAGATYDSQYVEHHVDVSGNVLQDIPKNHHFVIEEVDETIDVPAGTFRAVRIRRDTVGGTSKTYWFVRGVGKIREVGGQIEELTSSMVSESEVSP